MSVMTKENKPMKPQEALRIIAQAWHSNNLHLNYEFLSFEEQEKLSLAMDKLTEMYSFEDLLELMT